MAARADRDEEKTLPRSSASGSAATPHRGGRIGACANSACTLRPHASDMVRVIEVSFLNVLYFKFGFVGEGLKRSNRGSSNGRIYDFVVGRGLAPAVYRGFMTNNRLFAAGASPRPTGTPSMFILPINPNLKSAFAGRQVFSILPCTALTKKFFIPIDSQPYQCYNTVEPYYSNNTVQVRKACNT